MVYTKVSPFRNRLIAAGCFGNLVKSNGKYVVLPLDHHRPKEPFDIGVWQYGRLPTRRCFQDRNK